MKILIKSSNLLLFIVLVLLLAFFYLFYFFSKETRSEIVYFYPQNCLGSFVNPEKAQGEPEANNLEEINESNSAVYLGGFKEIYCGNFHGPVEEGEISKITLKFNLVLIDERKEIPIIESTSTKSLIEKILPAKEIEIINTSTQIEILTSSFKFFKFVYAEDLTQTNLDSTDKTQTGTNIDDIKTSTIDDRNSVDNKSTGENFFQTNVDNTQTDDMDKIEILTSSSAILRTSSSMSLFDIFYTFDGQNWNYLGSINDQNWQNISFEISINDWLMVPKIQIKVQSNPTIENIPYLYLESLFFEIEYESETDKDIHQQEISQECLEFKKKMDNYLLNNSSAVNNLKDTRTAIVFENKEKIVELISQNHINSDVSSYQLKITNANYEFWILDKSRSICKKIDNFNAQNLPTGIYENIFFYLDKNNVLNGYDLFSNNRFSMTFENNMIISFYDKSLKVNLVNNSLNFRELKTNE